MKCLDYKKKSRYDGKSAKCKNQKLNRWKQVDRQIIQKQRTIAIVKLGLYYYILIKIVTTVLRPYMYVVFKNTVNLYWFIKTL